MQLSDALLIGILAGIGVYHAHLRHGPRAAAIVNVSVVDADGAICRYVPVTI